MDVSSKVHNGHVSDDDDDEETWEETEQQHVDEIKCIFTEKRFPSADVYFDHLKTNHNFDILNLVQVDLKLDFFGYVKLINFLRKKSYDQPPSVDELIEGQAEWMNDAYLKPVVEDDPLLQYIIDDDDDFDDDEDPIVERNKELSLQVESLMEKVNEMKSFMKDVILTGDGDMYRPVSACRKTNVDLEEESYEDSSYFGSYAHHGIHGEMLQDEARTISYRKAILSNPDLFKDKIVLDVGCGTGILSMFAASAGAKHVYAVDMSDIAYQAMAIVRENNLHDKISIMKNCIEEVKLPCDKVDVIISEWMGYFLLYESMLDSVLFAKEKWLQPNGHILPDKCDLLLYACHDEASYHSQIGFWDDVYGFKMSCMKSSVLTEAYVGNLSSSSALSSPSSVFKFDILKVKQKELDFSTDFCLEINKSGLLTSIAGYFDIFFDLATPVSFSTAPWHQQTHWKQTLFFLDSPIPVESGQKIKGNINCRKNPADPRTLLVDLTINDKSMSYKMS